MGGNEQKYVRKAFDTNWVAPLGPNVNKFELDLEEHLQGGCAVALSSGTGALHLALILVGVEPDDEVICQSFTFAASANPIVYRGATPVFVDSEPDTWNMDPDLLEQAIRDRIDKRAKPKAIIPVHLYGMPAKMDEILEIANRYEIPVIEDAAEALGSSFQGGKCGSFGRLGVLSFNGNKIITTSGGGALVTNSKERKKEAVFLATQARDDAPHYQHSQIGYNYRMSNIVAGIGCGQMEVLSKRVSQRRAVFEKYFENLGATWLKLDQAKKVGRENSQHPIFNIYHSSPTGIYFLKEPDGHFSNRWLTTIIVNPDETGGVTRENIRLALEKGNIESRPLWKPMHLQPVYEDAPFYGNGISEQLFEYGLCLPSGSNMSDQDQDRVIWQVKDVLNRS